MEKEKLFKQSTGITFSEAYKIHYPKMVWFLLKMTKNKESAEDIAQDAMIDSLAKIESFDSSKAKFGTWLFTIAKNIMLNRFKKSKKYVHISTSQELDEDFTLEDTLESDDRNVLYEQRIVDKKVEYIRECIQKLPEKYRLVLTLRELENYSYQEVAEELDLNENTIKSQIRSGRAKLKELLEEKFGKIENLEEFEFDAKC